MPKELREQMQRPRGEQTVLVMPDTEIRAGKPKKSTDLRGGIFKLTVKELSDIFRNDGINTYADMLLQGDLGKRKDDTFKFKFNDDGELTEAIDVKTGKDITAKTEGETENVGLGFMCGGHVKDKSKGYAEGGEVKTYVETETPAAEVKPEGESSEVPDEVPGKGADMEGPFATYAEKGVDAELVRKGNELVNSLSEAIDAADEGKIMEYTEQLKGFIAEIESAKKEAAGSMQDAELGAALKEMSTDANDLMSAFQNIAKDKGSGMDRAQKIANA